MNRFLNFLQVFSIIFFIQGCSTIQDIDFRKSIDYEYLLTLEEKYVLHQYDNSRQSKIIKNKVITGYNETLVYHVVCVNEKCEKDNKYFVYTYYVEGHISQPENIHEDYSIDNRSIKMIKKVLVSQEQLLAIDEVIAGAEKDIKKRESDALAGNAKIARENAKIEAANQVKLEKYMATATYAPQIQIKRKVDFNCTLSCFQNNMKEVTSTDNMPFRIKSVVVNNRCNLAYPSNRVMHLGDTFIIPEYDTPYPSGCGKVLKVTLKTNRGTHDYDLR